MRIEGYEQRTSVALHLHDTSLALHAEAQEQTPDDQGVWVVCTYVYNLFSYG